MKLKIALIIAALVATSSAFATGEYCSFTVINTSNSNTTFELRNTKGTIGSLVVPVCSQSPQADTSWEDNPFLDPLALKNCAGAMNNTLFSHPSFPTCRIVNGASFYIQQGEAGQIVYKSKQPISTKNTHVVLRFPDDFDQIEGNRA